MAVASCCECGKLISLSVIPGGNPVAKELGWATSWVACPDCGRPRCDSCVAKNPHCPNCPGPPEPPSEASRLRSLISRCNAKVFTAGEMVWEAWVYTSQRPASSAIANRVQLLKEKLPSERFATLQAAADDQYDPESTGAYPCGVLFPDFDDFSEGNFVPAEFILALARGSGDATPPPPTT